MQMLRLLLTQMTQSSRLSQKVLPSPQVQLLLFRLFLPYLTVYRWICDSTSQTSIVVQDSCCH